MRSGERGGYFALVVEQPGLGRQTAAIAHELAVCADDPVAAHPVLDQAARELEQYFEGKRRTFSSPLAAAGTPFQREVWDALAAIPFGQSRSYAEIATAIGRSRAVRAVGAANGANPLSIFVPCHRVIGADGKLTGYGGGLPAKAWLLGHERKVAASFP